MERPESLAPQPAHLSRKRSGRPSIGAPQPGHGKLFEQRSFRFLWIGAFLSSIGTWVQDVALSWLIHTQTGDPFYLGLRRFAQDVPLLALMLIGGAIADRVDRRLILLSSQVVQMSLAALLVVLYFTGHLGIGAILITAFLAGLAQSQSAPTYQAVLPTLVPRAQIANAVALNSLQFNLSRAIGPVIAGLLLAWAGMGACFVVNTGSFVVVILVLMWIRFPSPLKTSGTLGQDLRDGIRHVSTTGASGYSLLLTSLGVGAMAGALTTAQRGAAPGRGRLTLRYLAAYGLVTIGAVLSSTMWLSMALLVGSGYTLTTALSTLSSLVQEHTPDELRGRVLSIFGLAFRGGLPIGSLVGGLFVRTAGAPAVMAVSSALLLVLAVVLLLRHRDLRAL